MPRLSIGYKEKSSGRQKKRPKSIGVKEVCVNVSALVIDIFACRALSLPSLLVITKNAGAKPDTHTYIMNPPLPTVGLRFMKDLPHDVFREETISQTVQSVGSLSAGRLLHASLVRLGSRIDGFRANLLIGMYTRFNSPTDASSVFNSMAHRDVVSWTSVMNSYTNVNDFSQALYVYTIMLDCCIDPPNQITFISALKACGGGRFLEEGMSIHASLVMRYGCYDDDDDDVVVATSLVNMYCNCGALEDALWVFYSMPKHNVATFNVLISGFREFGYPEKAMEMYEAMMKKGIKPSRATFLAILSLYMEMGALSKGKEIHVCVLEDGLEEDVLLGSALVSMYGGCRALDEARYVFERMKERTVVTWTAMIAAYAHQGYNEKAIETFDQMWSEGLNVDEEAFASILSACANLECLQKGRWIHECVVCVGYEAFPIVANALVTMYGACGSLEDALFVFKALGDRTIETWNSLIGVYVKQGHEERTFSLYYEMVEESVLPDMLTYLILLGACACLPSFHNGQYFHACIIERGYEGEIMVGNALINMYGKCGELDSANSMFQKMLHHDVISWTAIITSYAQQGNGKITFQLFERMLDQGVTPNEVTFLGILSVCSHVGLIDDACFCFMFMNQRRTMKPMTEHFVCMIDLLARAGCLDEAQKILSDRSLDSHVYANSALHRAWKTHPEVETRGFYSLPLLTNAYSSSSIDTQIKFG